jgi:type VI secretion system secreted protein VgrG
LTGTNLGGLTLFQGVYSFSSSADLTGALTLDFTGPDQTIVFKTGTTLTTASGLGAASVLIDGSFANDQVFWLVGSSATIGTFTSFAGNIIAGDSVSMNTSATDGCGSVIALTGAVTLQGNTISTGCSISGGIVTPTPIPPGTGTTVVVPEPGAWLLLGSIIAVLAVQRRWARAKAA